MSDLDPPSAPTDTDADRPSTPLRRADAVAHWVAHWVAVAAVGFAAISTLLIGFFWFISVVYQGSVFLVLILCVGLIIAAHTDTTKKPETSGLRRHWASLVRGRLEPSLLVPMAFIIGLSYFLYRNDNQFVGEIGQLFLVLVGCIILTNAAATTMLDGLKTERYWLVLGVAFGLPPIQWMAYVYYGMSAPDY